jgi:hypothetical protein
MCIARLIRYTFVTFLILTNFYVQGQERKSPQLIKSKGDYTHSSTEMTFPEQIEDYQRKTIYSFTKQDDAIEVTYEKPEMTNVAIKIYPAGDGVEGRLRNEYLKTLQTISNEANKTIGFEQGPVRRVGDKYICNGFSAVSHLKSKITDLILYECGSWFLKITITSKDLDSNQIVALEEKILNRYDPTKLTELKLLNLKSKFIVAPALGKDRDRAKYILNSGFKKLKWVNTNVPENERVSGFPDLYLNMHIEAFKEFAECKVEGYRPDNDIAKLIDDVNKVIKAGYLSEFIMKEYSMIMIVPDDMKFDFDGYEKFAQEQNISHIDMSKHYYLIIYPQQK